MNSDPELREERTDEPAPENREEAKRPAFHRVLALIAAILLSGLFIATILVAVFVKNDSGRTLTALIYLDVVLPAVIYGYVLITKQIRKK